MNSPEESYRSLTIFLIRLLAEFYDKKPEIMYNECFINVKGNQDYSEVMANLYNIFMSSIDKNATSILDKNNDIRCEYIKEQLKIFEFYWLNMQNPHTVKFLNKVRNIAITNEEFKIEVMDALITLLIIRLRNFISKQKKLFSLMLDFFNTIAFGWYKHIYNKNITIKYLKYNEWICYDQSNTPENAAKKLLERNSTSVRLNLLLNFRICDFYFLILYDLLIKNKKHAGDSSKGFSNEPSSKMRKVNFDEIRKRIDNSKSPFLSISEIDIEIIKDNCKYNKIEQINIFMCFFPKNVFYYIFRLWLISYGFDSKDEIVYYTILSYAGLLYCNEKLEKDIRLKFIDETLPYKVTEKLKNIHIYKI